MICIKSEHRNLSKDTERKRVWRAHVRRVVSLPEWRDIAYAARTLRRNSGFAILAAATLALGIGATSSLFVIVDRLLLRPPTQVRDPGTVARVYFTVEFPIAGPVTQSRAVYADYAAIRSGTHAFASTAAYMPPAQVILRTHTSARAIETRREAVTADFFQLLGVRAALGRLFATDEDRPPQGVAVAVLSYHLWQQQFGADPEVLGTTIDLDDKPYTVIGIAPRGFSGIDIEPADIWTPISTVAGESFGATWVESKLTYAYQIVVRLRPGVTREQGSADATLAVRRARDNRQREGAIFVRLGSIIAARGPRRETSDIAITRRLVGVTLLVLLIACANFINLLLAHATTRRREIAVRRMLGAPQSRLVIQLITEVMLLAILSGIAALFVALWGGDLLRTLLLPPAAWAESPINLRVITFTLLVAVATGAITGLYPAIRGSRADLSVVLKGGWNNAVLRPSRVRVGLVVLQTALSVVLLIAAGVVIRSLERARSVDLGFDAEQLLVVTADLDDEDRPQAERASLYEQMAERVKVVPGVQRATVASAMPFRSYSSIRFSVPGRDSIPRLGGDPSITLISPGFFETLGIKVLQGRSFTRRDRMGAERVAIVNQTMANVLWPGQSPIGKCIKVGIDTTPCAEIVGVVHDTHQMNIVEEPSMQFYLLSVQNDLPRPRQWLIVRTTADSRTIVPAVRSALTAVVRYNARLRINPLQESIDSQLRPWRLGSDMFGAFGLLALVLAATGLYSVISYVVVQRTHEMGIRIALGAQPQNVTGLIVKQSIRMTIAGVILGWGGALVVGRSLSPLLYGISAHDPVVFTEAGIALVATSIVASVVPAHRATSADPCNALRAE